MPKTEKEINKIKNGAIYQAKSMGWIGDEYSYLDDTEENINTDINTEIDKNSTNNEDIKTDNKSNSSTNTSSSNNNNNSYTTNNSNNTNQSETETTENTAHEVTVSANLGYLCELANLGYASDYEEINISMKINDVSVCNRKVNTEIPADGINLTYLGDYTGKDDSFKFDITIEGKKITQEVKYRYNNGFLEITDSPSV